MYVVPNLDDDMHNGTYATADTWIKNQLAVVFASRWYASGGIVILTWDEGEGPDQIATIVIAANDHGRRLATAGNHYGLLRCIEQAYGVSLLGNAGNAANGSLRPLF
jgi:acid phosphatase